MFVFSDVAMEAIDLGHWTGRGRNVVSFEVTVLPVLWTIEAPLQPWPCEGVAGVGPQNPVDRA